MQDEKQHNQTSGNVRGICEIKGIWPMGRGNIILDSGKKEPIERRKFVLVDDRVMEPIRYKRLDISVSYRSFGGGNNLGRLVDIHV
jgi:hypothetical protein